MNLGLKKCGVSWCCVGVLLSLLASPAYAQSGPKKQVRKKFKDKIHVLQRKPVLQKKRFELAPRFGTSFNDPLYKSFRVGVNANYHIAERVFVGATVDWYDFGGALGGATDVYQRVLSQTNSAPDTPVPLWSAGAEVGFVPVFGKFAMFNRKLGFYDLGITLGGAYVTSESIRLPTPTSGVGGTVSVFNHIFLNEWFSLNFEIRDTIYFANLKGASEKSLSHAASAAAGIGMFFPRKFEYTTPEGSPPDE